jgi:transcriptional regulator with XRE-family HTH domain
LRDSGNQRTLPDVGLRSITGDPVADRHWTCARRLSARRHAIGLTQTEVATRLEQLGVPLSNRTLSAMERGRGVDPGLLPALASALDCTVTYLVGLTTDPHRWEPDTAGTPSPARGRTEHRIWILGPQPPDPYPT